jgi:hypothetical protein
VCSREAAASSADSERETSAREATENRCPGLEVLKAPMGELINSFCDRLYDRQREREIAWEAADVGVSIAEARSARDECDRWVEEHHARKEAWRAELDAEDAERESLAECRTTDEKGSPCEEMDAFSNVCRKIDSICNIEKTKQRSKMRGGGSP